MNALQIRPATSSDVEQLLALARQFHAQHLASDPLRWTTSTPPPDVYAQWIGELIAGKDFLAVADIDGVIAGYLIAEVTDESVRHWTPAAVYVHDIFVAQAHRRRGAADGLMRALRTWAGREHPTLQVRLITDHVNDAARGFFARHGFRPCAVEMLHDGE